MGDVATGAQPLAQQMRERRSALMIEELEGVALRLFEERGFSDVTVQDIADQAHISARTFYRYFPTKEDVLQVRIDRRAESLRMALALRPADEAPMHCIRLAVSELTAAEDPLLLRRWINVIVAAPSVLQSVVGGIHLKTQVVMTEFFAARLGLPGDALVPAVLAAATGGVIQAANTHWYVRGGDLVAMISTSLEILERGWDTDPRTWPEGLPTTR